MSPSQKNSIVQRSQPILNFKRNNMPPELNDLKVNVLRNSIQKWEAKDKKNLFNRDLAGLTKQPMRFSTSKLYNNIGGEFTDSQ